MPRHRRVETPDPAERGQSTIEFALTLPLMVLSAVSLVAVLSVCIAVLDLNDTSRIVARAASTSEDPAATAAEMGSRYGLTVDTDVDAATGVISVTVTRSVRPWFFGGRLPAIAVRSTSHIMGEPQVILG